jgi:hypothetical protein
VRRALALLLLSAAACSFRSPAASGDGGVGDDDAPPDAGGEPGRCDLGASWEQGKQPTKTVYVTAGASNGGNGSQSKPYPTIADAIADITPGTRILLAPGTYSGATITSKQGTLDAPIWIEGPSTGGAKIMGGGGPGIHLVSAQYWVIRNLEIASLTNQPGINVDDGTSVGCAHHVVVDRVTIGSAQNACVQMTGVVDVTIRDATLGACDRGVMMVGVQRATIARTTIGAMVTAGVALAGGSADIEVRQSVIANVEGGVGIWIGGDSSVDQFRPALTAASGNTEATNVRVFDNAIRDVEDAFKCSNCTASLVAHNLIRRVSAFVFKLDQPYTSLDSFDFAPAGGVRLVDNAIEIGSSAEAFSDGRNGTDPASCTFSHNLWLKAGDAAWKPTLPSAETLGIYGKPSGYTDAGALCASAASPAAGAGAPVPGVDGTLQGDCRPSPPSIGPSEPDPGC